MFVRQILRTLPLVAMAAAYAGFRGDIPNGNAVRNPCDNRTWPGVGHILQQGGGPRNQFGLDFAAANFQWTQELCMKDSDGDGKSNGYELGDNNCDWVDSTSPVDTVQGHPGICEPLSLCRNNWFSCPSPKKVGK